MTRRIAPQDVAPPIMVEIPNELWEHDATTDSAFTADRPTRDLLVKELRAVLSGRYTIPCGESFRPAWQLTVKRIHRSRAKQILGVTQVTS